MTELMMSTGCYAWDNGASSTLVVGRDWRRDGNNGHDDSMPFRQLHDVHYPRTLLFWLYLRFTVSHPQNPTSILSIPTSELDYILTHTGDGL